MASDSETQSSFAVEADYEETLLDHYQTQFDIWIGQPMRILWSDYRGRTGIIIIAIYVLMGTVGTLVIPTPTTNQGEGLIVPFTNPRFPLGTDGLGQDLLGLMVHATPDMFAMMIAGALFGNLLGVTLGMIAGYMGGNIDKVIMTFTDSIGSIPGLPLIIILAALIEPTNPFLIGIIVNIQGWAGGSRGIRAQVFPVRKNEYVEASEALGEPVSNILVKDILPNLLPLVFIGFMGGMTTVIHASVALYFLGILPFEANNWGIVLNFAYYESGFWNLSAAHWLLVPSVTIVGLTFACVMVAQSADQVFNPRVRARHQARKVAKEGGDEDVDVIDSETVAVQAGRGMQ